MRRKLLIFMSILGALLTIALIAAWIRSFFGQDQVSWTTASQNARHWEWSARTIMYGRGRLRIDSSQEDKTGSAVRHADLPKSGIKWESSYPYGVYMAIDGPPSGFDWLGVVFASNRYTQPSWDGAGETRFFGWFLVIPFWLLTALTSFMPIIVISAALRRRYLARRGLCTSCGYNLRSSPDRCPECGAVTNHG